jgi:hypothetical protein
VHSPIQSEQDATAIATSEEWAHKQRLCDCINFSQVLLCGKRALVKKKKAAKKEKKKKTKKKKRKGKKEAGMKSGKGDATGETRARKEEG